LLLDDRQNFPASQMTTRFNIEVWSPAEFLDILRNIGVD
jgi:hypothetical protein